MDLVEKEEVVIVGTGGSVSSSGDAREEKRRVKIEGGMILEVAKGKVRAVEQFNDPGPSGEGNKAGNMGLAHREIFGRLGSGEWGVE